MGDIRTTAAAMLASDFATLPDLIRAHAEERGAKPALIYGDRVMDYAELDRTMDRIAWSLQRDGAAPGAAVAILGASSLDYALTFLGALRAGCVAAPLAPSATPEQLAAMVDDCGAPIVFHDAAHDIPLPVRKVAFEALDAWLGDGTPAQVTVRPADPFNIIYSSGTTGTPKGIVQPHAMRWVHIGRAPAGFGEAVTMVATPLYSNTTLVSFLPTLGWGGTVVLLAKFDAREYLIQAEKHRGSVTMLVPVQYQRLMADPEFDRFDLTSFKLKTCTSAPFSAALKADVVARWPGLLVEYYGMTEGGGTTALVCNAYPDKLHTVGKPLEGHDIRLIDDEDREVPRGEAGEVVGRSGAMMSGYHGRTDATDAATWYDQAGNRFIRHGDIGRFDEDGFLTLLDRKKDLIISGGFNVYPSDLEAVLIDHPGVSDCAVLGIPSAQWGETPVGFYVGSGEAAEILAWTNARLGKTQRLADLHKVNELPRSAIGKVLKRELRERYLMTPIADILAAADRHASGFRTKIPADWLQGRTAFGGLSAALALQAALDLEPDLPPLRSAQIAFIGPLAGNVSVTATKLRRGRNAAFIQSDLVSEAGLGLRATFVFMAELASAVEHDQARRAGIEPPALDAELYTGPDSFFTGNFNFFDPKLQLGATEWLRWARLRARDNLHPMVELLAIGDALPPGAFKLAAERQTPLSSLNWQINFLTPEPATQDGWWLLNAQADTARHGYSSQRMSIWNAAGDPIAEAMQGVAIFG